MRFYLLLTLSLAGCGMDAMSAMDAKEGIDDGVWCAGVTCPTAFHCEFDTCVADDTPPPPPDPERDNPLASHRYVFTLERDARRLVRIDSATLGVESFAAGLAPMDLGVIGVREETLLLDALDLVEILDHRQEPPASIAFTTARALSHLALAPDGLHAIAYFDWDDPRAQDRQPEPGNINQVSVLYLGDAEAPMAETDPRLVDVAVGFLPRDVRFSTDGTRAVVLGKETLTPIDLGGMPVVAAVQSDVPFDAAAAEILLTGDADTAILRYAGSARIDVLALNGEPTRCLNAPGPVLDAALDRDGRLIVLYDDGTHRVGISAPGDAAETCADIAPGLEAPLATRLVADRSGPYVLAFQPATDVERVWILTPESESVRSVQLEKAIGGVAFAGDGRFALLAHLKVAGTPAWDPSLEDPEISVDKAYGTSWLDLDTGGHRLAVDDAPFGPFTFVPAQDGSPGATFQSVLDPLTPQLLRVAHAPGFDDAWIDLAALPLAMGYLPTTERAYVTQDHPWGRVTFLDRNGGDLRHVTGFALSQE